MSTAVTFDGAPEQGTINFGVGQPSADLLPTGLLSRASARFFASAHPLELNYGQRQGDERFRAALAGFLGGFPGCGGSADSLLVSGGISQALDFACARFTQPGDVVLAEEPSYPYSFQVFRDHGLAIVGVPLDGEGMDVDACERLVGEHKPKLVYTIPSFHNPTGQTLPGDRRERLAALSLEKGFVLVADEVYQLLHQGVPPPPSFGTLAGRGNVLALGSFSKILAPGLRLGWIQASAALMPRLLSTGMLVSGGNFNHFTSHVVRQLLETGELAAFLPGLRARYAERAEAMDAALSRHLAGAATWRRPGGGYFFWVELATGADAGRFEAAARDAGTGFLPGAACSAGGTSRHCLRLSFAHYSPEQIGEGIARLGRALAP